MFLSVYKYNSTGSSKTVGHILKNHITFHCASLLPIIWRSWLRNSYITNRSLRIAEYFAKTIIMFPQLVLKLIFSTVSNLFWWSQILIQWVPLTRCIICFQISQICLLRYGIHGTQRVNLILVIHWAFPFKSSFNKNMCQASRPA